MMHSAKLAISIVFLSAIFQVNYPASHLVDVANLQQRIHLGFARIAFRY
jgi:hypothetical protein